MEDAALIYRITRAPEKRKFTIPVGLIPPKEVPEYMQMIGRNFKRQRFYNPTTGTFDERYSPLIQEDDFFLPRRPDGTGPDVDVLPGAENLDQIKDIEYFKKKMIAPMKIPFARVGIGDGAGEASEKSLSQSHSEFAKAVQWVQREAATGLTKVALIHLALRGYRVEDLRGFEIALTATSAMEELYRIETWQTRVSVMADLKDLGWFPKEWIVTHFTDLSPDEIQELREIEQIASIKGEDIDMGGEQKGGGMAGGIGGGMDIDDIGSPDENESLDVGEPGGDLDISDAELGLDAEKAPMEGFDYGAQKRLLREVRDRNIKNKMKTLLDSMSSRAKTRTYNSGLDYMLSSNELDGLSHAEPPQKSGGTIVESIHDPNGDSGIIVEWSVDLKTRNEAILESYAALIDDQESETVSSDEASVTPNDLPSQ
jgi:hypothetical protein